MIVDAELLPREFRSARSVGAPDLWAIRQLFHVYCQRIDQGLPADIASLFAEDGLLVLAFQGKNREQVGREAIAAWFTDYMKTTRQRSRHNRHAIGGLWAVGVGDRAFSYTFWDAQGVDRETAVLHQLRGFYRDWLVRREGRWFFERREIHIWDTRDCDTLRIILPEPTIPRLAMRVWSYEQSEQTYFSNKP